MGRETAALSGRMARHLQPTVPAWDQAGPPLPWWEAVTPTPSTPRRIKLDETPETQNLSASPEGELGTGERGWTPLKRILIALSTLAALFLVVGAHTQWP